MKEREKWMEGLEEEVVRIVLRQGISPGSLGQKMTPTKEEKEKREYEEALQH